LKVAKASQNEEQSNNDVYVEKMADSIFNNNLNRPETTEEVVPLAMVLDSEEPSPSINRKSSSESGSFQVKVA